MVESEFEVIEPKTEEAQEAPEPEVQEDAEFEASEQKRAEAMGWRPLSEFNGIAGKWKDYPEFLAFGDDKLGVMSENMATMQRKLVEMERLQDVQNSTHQMDMKAQKIRIVNEYEDKMRDAVQDGDVEAFDKASKQRDEQVEAYEEPDPSVNAYAAPMADFMDRNSWYGTEEGQVASDHFDAEGHRIRTSGRNLSPTEEMKEAEKSVRKKFPELYGNPKRTRAAAVGSGRRPIARKGPRTYEAMSPEEQQGCDDSVKAEFSTREQFVKNHFTIKDNKA